VFVLSDEETGDREQETGGKTPVARGIYPRIALGRIDSDPYGLSFEGIRK